VSSARSRGFYPGTPVSYHRNDLFAQSSVPTSEMYKG